MAETKYEARLKTLYNESIAKELKDELKLNNINEVPKLDKVIVSQEEALLHMRQFDIDMLLPP